MNEKALLLQVPVISNRASLLFTSVNVSSNPTFLFAVVVFLFDTSGKYKQIRDVTRILNMAFLNILRGCNENLWQNAALDSGMETKILK